MTNSRTRTATSSAPTTVVSAVSAVIAMAALVAALALTEPAAAHAAYASSTPAFAEVLEDSPESLELRFSQELFRRAGANTMRLERAADGAAIGLGQITIENAERAAMRADLLEPLEAGRYLVSWQNLSADDGDDDSGTYPFYVGRGPTEAEQAADREIARDLLIPYPGDEAEAAEGAAVEARAPTVLRSEAEPTGGLAIGAALWLAVGAVAFAGLGAAWVVRRRAT